MPQHASSEVKVTKWERFKSKNKKRGTGNQLNNTDNNRWELIKPQLLAVKSSTLDTVASYNPRLRHVGNLKAIIFWIFFWWNLMLYRESCHYVKKNKPNKKKWQQGSKHTVISFILTPVWFFSGWLKVQQYWRHCHFSHSCMLSLSRMLLCVSLDFLID